MYGDNRPAIATPKGRPVLLPANPCPWALLLGHLFPLVFAHWPMTGRDKSCREGYCACGRECTAPRAMRSSVLGHVRMVRVREEQFLLFV